MRLFPKGFSLSGLPIIPTLDERSTSNIQRPTPNGKEPSASPKDVRWRRARPSGLRCSMFNVRCSAFAFIREREHHLTGQQRCCGLAATIVCLQRRSDRDLNAPITAPNVGAGLAPARTVDEPERVASEFARSTPSG